MDFKKLILSLAATFSAGFLGSIFTTSSIPTWYTALNKPFFSPPNYIFAPVWSLLYLLMAVSLYLVWTKKGSQLKKGALRIFALQLVLNFLWSVIFFGMRSPELALVNIGALWISIFFTILAFNKISKPAAYLLIPYLLWVSFASILNLAIVILN